LEKAHKHTDEPTHAHICEQIELEIWSFIDERFEFDRIDIFVMGTNNENS